MVRMVIRAISDSVQNLSRQDFEATERLLAEARAISRQRFAIEAEAIALLASDSAEEGTQQATALLEMATELERIGEDVVRIAKISLRLGAEPLPPDVLNDVRHMAELVCNMLNQTCEIFGQRDVDLLGDIATHHRAVQSRHSDVFRKLYSFSSLNSQEVDRIACLRRVAFSLARMADGGVSISEWVVFAVTGQIG